MQSCSSFKDICRHSGNGGTQTCLPAACGVAQGVAQYGPSSSTHAQDPREGPSLAGRTTGGFRGHGLVRLACEEAERSSRGTSRGAHDASHDDRGQVGARRVPACAESLFPLWCKGGKRKQEYQAKATISVQQDQDQQNGRIEVIVEPKPASSSEPLAGGTNFSQDKCTRCSPLKRPIVGALPAQYLRRGPGPPPINRTSHPQGRGQKGRKKEIDRKRGD